MSNSKTKRCFRHLETSDEVLRFAMKRRKTALTKRSWWDVDLKESNYGATALVIRCMQIYGWDLDRAKDILKAYRQFLTLKKNLADWDATILSPSQPVDQMWRQHILDIENYWPDVMLLCGRVALRNDEALDPEVKKARDERTRTELIRRFKLENVNREIWQIPPAKKIQVIIKDPKDHQVSYQVERGYRLILLMERYAKQRGLEISEFRFFYHGKPVEKFATSQALVDGDNTIDMVPTDKASSRDQINIFVKDENGRLLKYRLKRTTPMKRVLSHFATHHKVHAADFRFVYNGQKVEENDTPGMLNMKTDDIIYMVAPSKRIWISIRDKRGQELWFRTQRDKQLREVFKEYAKHTGKEYHDLQFLSGGHPVCEENTPASCEFENGQCLDCTLFIDKGPITKKENNNVATAPRRQSDQGSKVPPADAAEEASEDEGNGPNQAHEVNDRKIHPHPLVDTSDEESVGRSRQTLVGRGEDESNGANHPLVDTSDEESVGHGRQTLVGRGEDESNGRNHPLVDTSDEESVGRNRLLADTSDDESLDRWSQRFLGRYEDEANGRSHPMADTSDDESLDRFCQIHLGCRWRFKH